MTAIRTPSKLAAQAHWFRKRAENERARGRPATARSLLSEAIEIENALAENQRCRVCGRELKTDESKARGIGPECLSRQEK